MPKPPRPSASEVLRHNLLILIGLPSLNPNLFQNEMVISMMWNDQEYKKRTFLWLQKLVGKFVVLLFFILHGDLLFSLD